MGKLFDRVVRLVAVRPWATLAVLAVVTLVLASGTGLRAPQAERTAFLPQGSRIAQALEDVETHFGNSAQVAVVTLLFRGDALTPPSLAQMDRFLQRIAAEPGVADFLVPGGAFIAPTQIMAELLETDNFDDVSQERINAALDHLRAAPGQAPARAALDAMVGSNAAGQPVAVATVRLSAADQEAADAAAVRINDLARAEPGPLAVSTVSHAVIKAEYQDATGGRRLLPLLGIALLIVAALLLLFTRALSDLLLTLAGLLLALIWTIGAEGWLGPNGLNVVGPPNALTGTVPIILISLAVDYAIQMISHYRDQRAAGQPVTVASRTGLRIVIIPLLLASVTTVAAFMATRLSPVSAVGDFGVVAGVGVGLSLIVMLTLLPAARIIIDRRREARGVLAQPRLMAHALPGIDRLTERLGTSIARHPAPYVVFVAAISVGLGIAATNLTTDFSLRDLLPSNGNLVKDMQSLDEAFHGSTEAVNILVEAELTETRPLQNLFSLTEAFEDELSRPRGAADSMDTSLPYLITDWVTDDGPEDRYDPELERLFAAATAGLHVQAELAQQFLDRLAISDPDGTRRVLINNPNGVDTTLLRFLAYSGTGERTKAMMEDVNGLWFGDDEEIVMTSDDIITLTTSSEIADQQTQAIIATILAALCVLTVFFWATLSRPALAFIAVAPTVVVLIWVLGTMALLNIPYSILTSIITALSIGLGVDYTIHIIHRYQEEFSRVRKPEAAAIRTLATTGSALLGSALTTALGFAVLTLSPVPSLGQFGLMAAISISYAFIVSILVVPSAMTVWGAYQNMRLRSMVERFWEDLDVVIEDTYRHRQAD